MKITQGENLDFLIGELGFHACPWDVTYYKFKGSVQLEKKGSPFNFYLGPDWAAGQYFFFQELEELRLIEDDILLLMIDNGLPFPDTSRDTGPEGILYTVGFRGEYAREVYGQLGTAEKAIQAELKRIPVSGELAEAKFELISRRFAMRMEDILAPIGDIDTYRERREQRETDRKSQLVGQMACLIQAVREGAKVKFGTIVERIEALSPLGYDPHPAIQNILSGKYNNSLPQQQADF